MPIIGPPDRQSVTANEPLVATATVTSLVAAVVALVVAFGADLTAEQEAAILGVTAVIAPAVVIVARRWVTPTAKVVEYAEGGEVLAGPANERRETDARIRDIGGAVQPPSVIATPSETAIDGYEARHFRDDDGDGVPDVKG